MVLRDGPLLYLASPGIGLSARGGHLLVRGEGDDEQFFPPHNHRLQCVIAANKGFVSFDALAWLAREHVALLIYSPDGIWQVIADAPAGRLSRQELALRERQMRCVFNPQARLAAARAIVAAKLDTLALDPDMAEGFATKLAKARTMADVLSHEAKHAEAYWRLWHGQEIAIQGECPAAWRAFKTRTRTWRTGRLGEGGAQFSNRFALTPVNAMLNFSGAIVAAQCGRACAGLGLDPAIGTLHSARPGMAALAWDIFELLRARVAEAVFRFCGRCELRAEWFKIEPKPRPHVRFGPDIARPLAAWTVKAVPWKDVVKAGKQVAKLF